MSNRMEYIFRPIVFGTAFLMVLVTTQARAAPRLGTENAIWKSSDPSQGGVAYQLVMRAAACWFGGVWGDAEGLSLPARAEEAHQSCREVVSEVYGRSDHDRYLQLRAFDPRVMNDLTKRVSDIAAKDVLDSPHRVELLLLVRGLAAAQRESMMARRAADLVKKDIGKKRDTEKKFTDEKKAQSALNAHEALDALYNLHVKDLTADARALGLLVGMDRMKMAEHLPKQLKIAAVGGVFRLAFGVNSPVVETDGTRSIKSGTWLSYLSSVAAAAGHPALDSTKNLKSRRQQAWMGIRMGFADKLRATRSALSSEGEHYLDPVLHGVIVRLSGSKVRSSDRRSSST